MKITTLNILNVSKKEPQRNRALSFKSSNPNNNVYINSYTNKCINAQKSTIINKNLNETLDYFKAQVQDAKNHHKKFDNINNKTVVLEKMADAYYSQNNIEKATALTVSIINNIYDDQSISDKEKQNKILTNKHLDILNKYWDISPFGENITNKRCHNVKLMAYASETMNKLGYKEFLPYAEKICDSVYIDVYHDLSLKDYRSVNTPARKLINKHYDLNCLKTFLDKDKYYKNGMLHVLSKWGLPEHSGILKTMINEDNKDYKLKAIEAIGNIGDENSIKLLNNFLNLKRSGLFTVDSDYNTNAFVAISKIDSKNARELIENYINKDEEYSPIDYKNFLDVLCMDNNVNCLPQIKDKLGSKKTYLYGQHLFPSLVALSYIKHPEIKKFIIEQLEENRTDLDYVPSLIQAIGYQDIDNETIDQVKKMIPKDCDFSYYGPYDCGHRDYLIKQVYTNLNNLKKIVASGESPSGEGIYEIKQFNGRRNKYKEGIAGNLLIYRHLHPYTNINTKETLNNYAANANGILVDGDGKPEKNRKESLDAFGSEMFTKIFVRGKFNWSDIKENVK